MIMPPEADLAVAISKIDAITNDMSDLKSTMKELVTAVGRLAVVEERQTSTNDSMGRAFKQLDTLSAKVSALELAQPIQKQSSDLVQKAVGYVVAVVLGAIVAGIWRAPQALPDATVPAISSK